MTTYLATHSVAQVLVRELRGLGLVAVNALVSHGWALMLLVYVGFFIALARERTYRERIFRRDPTAAWWLVVPYLAAYLLLFGFWGDISAGNRFILGIAAPALFAVGAALERADEPKRARFDLWMRRGLAVALLTYYPYAVLTHYSGG
jgi:hypothetical protein